MNEESTTDTERRFLLGRFALRYFDKLNIILGPVRSWRVTRAAAMAASLLKLWFFYLGGVIFSFHMQRLKYSAQ